MRHTTPVLLLAVVAIVIGVAGCTGEQVRRATYNALHDKNCIDKVGYSNCDPNRPSYDQYQRERDKTLEQDQDQDAN